MRSSFINSVKLLAAAMLLFGFAAAAAENYHLVKKVSFGPAPGGREYFDYITVDSSARRVYLSHGTEILVTDADTGALVGKISGLTLSHGVALLPELRRGFITDGAQGKIVIFDLKTLKVIGEVNAAKDADGILYDRVSKHIFCFNGDSNSSTVIDPANGAVVGTIDLHGAPEFAVADGKGMIYDNLEDKNEVVAIDSRTLVIKSRWPISPAGAPAPLAIDREHRRLFVAGRNPQMVALMDADNGKVIQALPISAGADACVFDPARQRLFVSTREGWIHIFHEDSPNHLAESGKVKTEYGAKTMGFDPRTGRIFVDTAEFKEQVPDTEHPHPRPVPVPNTFHLLIYEP